MVSLLDVFRARRRIQPYVTRTPLLYSEQLSELTGGEIFLKLENRQQTGSFKLRGAFNKMLIMPPEKRSRGVVTSSAGNHGQGLGVAGRTLGVPVTVVVPGNTPDVKRSAMRRLGVTLIVHGGEYMEAERHAQRLAEEEGLTFVSPYNDLDLIAGQGTLALEMLEEEPGIDTVLVPLGGGGLASGVATVWKNASEAKVIGVQSRASPVMYESLKAGRIVDVPLEESLAEGLHGGIEPGSVTFDLCWRLLDGVTLVNEEGIAEAIRWMLLREREVVEGAGAVGVASILAEPGVYRNHRVGVVVSGGNIDESEIRRLLA